MTALNVWRQQDAAYLLTDTAWYDEEDGARVLAFGPKVIDLQIAPVALAFCGSGVSNDLILEYLERNDPGLDADRAIALLPDLLRFLIARADDAYPGANHRIGAGAAIFSYARNQPEAWRCDSTDEWLGRGYTPFLPVRVAEAFNSRSLGGENYGLHKLLGRDVDPTDPHQFDARRDGLAVIEAQRQIPVQSGRLTEPACIVGGAAILAEVSAAGIKYDVLTTWPDQIGEVIDPKRAESVH